MSFDPKKHHDELLFLPLGGSGEIGMNLNLYQYQGKWLMVDLGAGFADDYFPGVDMIVPDISFIIKHKKNLVGLVLTHAHEDHLGAVQYLWNELQCPIYTTAFTANFLRIKLKEANFSGKIKINIIPEGGTIDLDPFKIEAVPLTHSTPEMQSLVIKTELGNVFHTGDWKFDNDPLIGKPANFDLLRKYGDEGILALVGDSTNVFNDTASGSEGALRESLTELISRCKDLVVVTTFASNVARLETIIKAAETNNRKVAIAGRSLLRIIAAAKDSGYLTDSMEFIAENQICKLPKSEVLVIATGCQGERLAAINKMASSAHHNIHLSPGDTVIFSSKIIPGNEKRIFALFNKFVHKKTEVLTEKDHFVHVSGHPSRVELKTMYDLIRPKIAVPVHGELVHMHEHINIARETGVKHTVQIENGLVARLAPGDPEIIAQVHSDYLAIDGHYLLPTNSGVMKMRRRITLDGVIIITLILSKNWDLIERPVINCPGSLDDQEDAEVIAEIADSIADAIEDSFLPLPKGKKTETQLENLVRTQVRKLIKQEVGKSPPIELNIIKI